MTERAILVTVARADLIICSAPRWIIAALIVAIAIWIKGRRINHVSKMD